MILYLKTKLIAGAVAVSAAFGAGWVVKGKFEDSNDLVAEIREEQAQISKQLEDQLGELRASERVIDRGVIREIQKPISRNVCFEPELVRLLNKGLRGETGTDQ